MMPARTCWKGYPRLSLVSIAIEVIDAKDRRSGISFHQIHRPTGRRSRRVSSTPNPFTKGGIALSQGPLLGAGKVTCFGIVLDGAQVQQIAGIVMLLAGAIVYLAGGRFLVAQLLRDKPANASGKQSARPEGRRSTGSRNRVPRTFARYF